MKRLMFILALMPFIGLAHPGIGIVKDSKGNIFYTDLHQVWKITNGKKTVAVPNVHTHELYVDTADNLYGEGGYYDDRTKKFFHYMWVYRPGGQIDTVVGMNEAYVRHNFSLAKDTEGNEYYTKQFLKTPDTTHLFRKSPGVEERVMATGNFKGVIWLHPQENGSVLYVQNNTLYTVDTSGKIKVVKEGLANRKPSFKFSGNSVTVWGTWQDNSGNVYVAAFSDQTVKRIDPNGNMTIVYQTEGAWTPLHGVFDDSNRLWVLEGSDKNEVRVTMDHANLTTPTKTNAHLLPLIAVVCCAVLGMGLLLPRSKSLLAFKLKRLIGKIGPDSSFR